MLPTTAELPGWDDPNAGMRRVWTLFDVVHPRLHSIPSCVRIFVTMVVSVILLFFGSFVVVKRARILVGSFPPARSLCPILWPLLLLVLFARPRCLPLFFSFSSVSFPFGSFRFCLFYRLCLPWASCPFQFLRWRPLPLLLWAFLGLSWQGPSIRPRLLDALGLKLPS